MKPTVKSFLALAEDKEQTVHIARFKSDYQLIDALTGKILVDRVCDKTNSKSSDEEWIDHCKYEPYKDWKVRKWRLVDRKMQLYISR